MGGAVTSAQNPSQDEIPTLAVGGVKPRGRRADFFVAFLGLFMQMGTGLIMLPFVAATLPPEAFAFFYVFMTLQMLVQLINNGAVFGFTRHITYVLSGARELTRDGVPLQDGKEVDVRLLSRVINASRRVHMLLAVFTTTVVSIFGSIYIARLASTAPDLPFVWESWWLFAAAIVMHIYFNWQIPIQFGADRMRDYYLTIIVSRLVQVVFTIVGLTMFPNLLTAIIGFALGAVALRICVYISVRDIIAQCRHVPRDKAEERKALDAVVPNAWAQTLVGFGEFSISRSTLLIAPLFIGVGAASQYAAASQALFAVDSVSRVAAAMLLARITNARVEKDQKTVQGLVALSFTYAVCVFVTGAIALLLFGPGLLALIGSGTSLPARSVIVLLAFVFLSDLVMNLSTMLIATGNKIPYLRANLISGAAVVVGMFCVGFLGYGIVGFILIQGGVLWAFSAWRWPTHLARDVGLTPTNFGPSAVHAGRKLAFGQL